MKKMYKYLEDMGEAFGEKYSSREAYGLAKKLKKGQKYAYPTKVYTSGLKKRLRNLHAFKNIPYSAQRSRFTRFFGVFASFLFVSVLILSVVSQDFSSSTQSIQMSKDQSIQQSSQKTRSFDQEINTQSEKPAGTMMRSLPSNASEDISKNTMQDASVEPENNVFPDEIDQFLQNEFLPQDMETSFSSEQMREFQTICENTSGRAENTLCIFSPKTQCTLSEILELDGDDCLHIP